MTNTTKTDANQNLLKLGYQDKDEPSIISFYFKDFEGKELKYVVYSKFITTDGDMTFLDPDETKPVIALSCCTDANDENRIIVLGRAEI